MLWGNSFLLSIKDLLSWILVISHRPIQTHDKGYEYIAWSILTSQAQIAKPEDTAPFQKYFKNNLYGKVWRRTGRLVKYYKRSCIFEPPGKFCFFDPSSFYQVHLKANVYLVGYWQTEKYFTSIENIIRNDFILKDAAG